MGKRDQIVKKSTRLSLLDVIKELTNILTNKQFELNKVEYIINHSDINVNIILRRIISYLYNYPWLIKWINNYLNNLYDFSKLFSNKELQRKNLINLIHTFWYVFRIFNLSKKHLLFLSGKTNKEEDRIKVINLLKSYFSLNKITVNDRELYFYYKLYQIGIITKYDLENIYVSLSDKEKAKFELTGNFVILDVNNTIDLKQNDNKKHQIKRSPLIGLLTNEIFQIIQNRQECRNCPLFDKPKVILDTNIESFDEEVDVAFIGLNPGKDEAIQGLPFVGTSGKKLRQKIAWIINKKPDFKYIITNMILSSTRNAKEIGDINQVSNNCKELFLSILKRFKIKYYIILGGDIAKFFGINESISKVSGNIYNERIIPIIHPSSLRSTKMENIWKKSWNNVLRYILPDTEGDNIHDNRPTIDNTNNNYNNINNNISNNRKKVTIKNKNLIEKYESNLTLFDIRQLNDNKVLKIFVDENGIKKYLIEDLILHVGIKYGDFKDMGIVNKDFNDWVVINNKFDKHKIMNTLKRI